MLVWLAQSECGGGGEKPVKITRVQVSRPMCTWLAGISTWWGHLLKQGTQEEGWICTEDIELRLGDAESEVPTEHLS